MSYTKPELRERLKNEIMNKETAGTEKGKWSARKAQMLARKYKEQGGGYKGKRTAEQKNIQSWDED